MPIRGRVSVGFELAGQPVTLRMDGTQMGSISHDGTLLRTVPCPFLLVTCPGCEAPAARASSRLPPAGPVTMQRRVSQGGWIMVATQRIQVGMIQARKIVSDR